MLQQELLDYQIIILNNMKKIILHLCADTGSDTKPYKDNGYEVIRIGKDIGVENYHPPKNVYGVIAQLTKLFKEEMDLMIKEIEKYEMPQGYGSASDSIMKNAILTYLKEQRESL